MYLVVTFRSEGNQTVVNTQSAAAFTAWYIETPVSCLSEMLIYRWVIDGTYILGGAGSRCDNIKEMAKKVNKIKARQRSPHFKGKYTARRWGGGCQDNQGNYFSLLWSSYTNLCPSRLVFKAPHGSLYLLFVHPILSYLINPHLLHTVSCQRALPICQTHTNILSTSLLSVRAVLHLYVLWPLHIDHSQLHCGRLQVPFLFPSLPSTQFNVSTHFPTCLHTSVSTKQAAFMHLLSASIDGQAVLQYTSYAWMCKTTVLSSSWFFKNFSSHLFMMPTSN